ncbi:accessory Sec system S-layer assembly protein [Brevibacillus daliensis]|uniref:accessory Sec system S-layer assembly protein n=1 Tax=Brevibacillus daliensis TaxID=2892995 RepID=UPI001E529E3A|nr:accessory Sec system S-layer assembly protein [Brevibacillus daliensis]
MISFIKNMLSGKEKEELPKSTEESVLPVEDHHSTDSTEETRETTPTNGASSVTATDSKHVTELSLHSQWERELDNNAKYSLSFMASELEPLQDGNIAISGLHMVPHEEGIEVTAFVRNGTNRPTRLGKMTLLILIEGDRLFTRQEFDMGELGEIPAYSARPWSFLFKKEHYLITNIALANWKLAFELAQKKMILPQNLELEESWMRSLTDKQKDYFIQLAKSLPPLKEGEVNVQSVQASKQDDGTIRTILLIRNGSTQDLSIEKLPLAMYDAAGDKVAEGLFTLTNFVVHKETSKPWMFIFPADSVCKQEPDLSRWKVQVPSQ